MDGPELMAMPPRQRRPPAAVPSQRFDRMPANMQPRMPGKKKQRWAKAPSSQTSTEIVDANDVETVSDTESLRTADMADFESLPRQRPVRASGEPPFRAGGRPPRRRPPGGVGGPASLLSSRGGPANHQMRGAMFNDAPEVVEHSPGFEDMKEDQRGPS